MVMRVLLSSVGLLLVMVLAGCTGEQGSGIFLCGEFNKWHPDTSWEFKALNDSTFLLCNKVVYLN